jgi:hypothetical protein
VRILSALGNVFEGLGSDGKTHLGFRYSFSDVVHVLEGLTNDSIRYALAHGTAGQDPASTRRQCLPTQLTLSG